MILKNSVALVTGSAQRVGRTIALALAERGVKLGLHYHTSESAALSLLEEIRSKNGDATSIQADLTKLSDIKAMADACYQTFGKVDILINNAATYYKTPFDETTETDWQQILDVNLKAPFFCAKYVAGYMNETGGGKIINISDVSAYSPWINYVPYCVSKAGVMTLTKGLAKELAPDIQVNAIAPGTVLMAEDASDEYTQRIIDKTLLKRIGSPQDIGNTVVFLLQDSDYITGAIIPVDGGSSLTT